jgi:hypothetical protein
MTQSETSKAMSRVVTTRSSTINSQGTALPCQNTKRSSLLEHNRLYLSRVRVMNGGMSTNWHHDMIIGR